MKGKGYEKDKGRGGEGGREEKETKYKVKKEEEDKGNYFNVIKCGGVWQEKLVSFLPAIVTATNNLLSHMKEKVPWQSATYIMHMYLAAAEQYITKKKQILMKSAHRKDR